MHSIDYRISNNLLTDNTSSQNLKCFNDFELNICCYHSLSTCFPYSSPIGPQTTQKNCSRKMMFQITVSYCM